MEKVNDKLPAPVMDSPSRVARKHDVSWPTIICLAFLLINSITTIWRSRHEPGTVAFVIFCNVDILLLFWCQTQFESASVKKKEVLKTFVWILTTLLTVAFSHRVAGMMPLVMAVIVWGMAGISISGSFYALFVYDAASHTTEGKTALKQPC